MATETSKLKIGAADLKAVVNRADEPELFQYGDRPGVMSEADVVALIELEEREFISATPEKYSRVLDGHVDLQILVHKDMGARGGETTLQLGLYPIVPDTVVLYKNYLSNNLPWASRRYEHALTETTDYTVNDATGLITLTSPLAQGDFVYGDYQHDGGALIHSARKIVLKMCRLELYESFPNWNAADEVLKELREEIDNSMLEFQTTSEPRGLYEIDKLKLVTETRRSKNEPLRRRWMGGGIG